MLKIDASSSWEEIEINGEVYRLDLTDEAINRFSEGSDFLKKSTENMSAETLDNFEKCKIFCRDFINGMMLDEPFEAIYAGLGNSTIRTVELIPKLLKAYTDLARETRATIKAIKLK